MMRVGNLFFGPPPAEKSRDLLERLQNAPGPSRSLDLAVREFELICDPVLNPITPPPPPPYTSDIEVAKRFVEHVAPPLWEELQNHSLDDLSALEILIGCIGWLLLKAERGGRHA